MAITDPTTSAWQRALAWVRQARRDRLSARARRVVLLLLLLWVINGFDLAFTLLAARTSEFHEGNPVAAALVATPFELILFKVLMVAFASCVLLVFRRRLITEVCCWGLCAAYSWLSAMWWSYYAFVGAWHGG